MGEMTRAEIAEAFEAVVANRVPYYGEYLVQTEEGAYELNEKYLGTPTIAD
jgi:cyclic pyranopterin phosphate synthase